MTKFVIGIGSQRAGSTLLSRILEECTKIFTHPVKELHYYDTLFNVRSELMLKQFSKSQLELLQKSSLDLNIKRNHCQVRTNKILLNRSVEQIEYLDLFRPCIMDNEYLCEITPEYMILPEDGIIRMAQDIGVDAKIILLARNPVQRFISAVKLLKSYGKKDYRALDFEGELLHVLKTMPTWMEQQDQLNDYASSLNRYKKHFDNVLFLAYDDLFKQPLKTATQLQDFLCMPLDAAKYQNLVKKKVNSLSSTGNISQNTIDQLKQRYSQSQDFLDNFFGLNNCIS